MAKYGEGDKRWIVEERPDGANVHNWHWAETDCLEWSRNLLSSLLSNHTLLSGDGNLFITTKKLEKVEGEAYVNIRKGKIIPGYEISLSLPWEGEAKDADGKTLLRVEGTVEVPYIADENADEDPEGGPAKEELEVKKPAAKKPDPATGGAPAAVVKRKEEEKKKKREGFKSISLSEKFSCRAKDMFEILMDENRWKGFTQSNARISKEVGGEFSIFDGAVTGTNVELQEGKLIVQKWRFGNWPDGIQSTVRLTFEEPEPGVTIVKLTQTDVPEEDRYGNATVVDNTERGWRDLIFHKIRAVFGFGI
ncbi:aha1 domain-containing protein [Actinidia rufa]|uniref:Aha1 domain-containing protein n=1 Tax=Actinidia rufa TaxID=165716 RepID=A0A7J0HD74_9ERIC|nr:aha1 domain-containing protein [Actinidia rufa]